MLLNKSPKKLSFLLLLSVFLFLHFSSSHPVSTSGGYTGAPTDASCLNCHNTGSINGNIQLSGVPATVDPGVTYPLTVTVNNTVGAATRAGFQIVTLRTATNLNSGTYSIPASESNAVTKSSGGKNYAGHQVAKSFASNTLTYDIEWTAPTNQNGQQIRFYAAALIANGTGTSGDRFVTTNETSTITGGMSTPLDFTFENIGGVACNGDANGTATVAATGGSGTYMYSWANGENGATATMLSAGPHNVTVSDSNSEMKVGTVDIPDATAIIAGIVFESDVTCFGGNDGEAQLQASGGTGNLSFDWGAGITGPTQTTLSAGSYTVTVQDDNNCQATVSLDIEEPIQLEIFTTNLTAPTCSDSEDGSITINVNGGILPYDITWSPNIGTAAGNTLSNIPSGEYTVDVLDNNQCHTSSSITLDGPDPITIMFSDVINESCQGAEDGSATVQATGGTGNYTYLWSTANTTQSIFDLGPGTYSVTVTDEMGCDQIGDVAIMAGGIVEVELIVLAQPVCGNMGGEIFANVLQITGMAGYQWSNGVIGDESISGLSAGSYAVTLTDQNGCSDEASIMLEEQNDMQASIVQTTDVTCGGGSNGTASLAVTGGQSPYQFLWPDTVISMQRLDLEAGTYMVTVSDAAGCMEFVTVDIDEPIAISVSIELLLPAGCQSTPQGAITLAANGGTGDLSYLWNTGSTESSLTDLSAGTYSCTVSDENDCEVEVTAEVLAGSDLIVQSSFDGPFCHDSNDGYITLEISSQVGISEIVWLDDTTQTTTMRGDLSADTYVFVVTDSLGCMRTDSITLMQPAALESNLSIMHETGQGLADGSATVDPAGGTAPYQIEWSTGEVSLSIADLAPGSYSTNIIDANGCLLSNDFVIFPFGCELIATTTQTNNFCANDSLGQATAVAAQGTPPYTYTWSTGDTIATIDNLISGIYEVTVADIAGCTFSTPVTISQPSALVLNPDITSPTNGQSNGSIAVTVTGGVSPYQYQWNIGDTITTIQDLGIGTYTLTVTDANGCTMVNTTDLQNTPCINELVVLEISAFSCFGRSESTITVGLEVSDSTVTYIWNDGSIGTTIDSIPAGVYSVTATTANGCEYSLETSISENTEIQIDEPIITDESAVGATDGTVTISEISGGTVPYTYQWFDESNSVVSTEAQLTAGAGTYYLCITDSLLCNGLFGPYEISVSTTIVESASDQIKVFPNPTSSDILISAKDKELLSVEIIDIQGRSVYSVYPNAVSTHKIAITNLVNGTYLVKIKTQAGVFTQQVQVIK